jgi:site-specific recombinase XerD
MTRQNVNAFLADLGREAGFDFPLHPHLLRHATGYKLANALARLKNGIQRRRTR